jgi:hypothetical protein
MLFTSVFSVSRQSALKILVDISILLNDQMRLLLLLLLLTLKMSTSKLREKGAFQNCHRAGCVIHTS